MDAINTLTILLVEDDADTQALYVEAISLLTTYHVYAVKTGTDALQIVTQVGPSLFILDYRLPQMNGLELYDRLHAILGLENVPAIIISATSLEPLKCEIESRKLTFLQKPFHLNIFVDTIEQVLDQPYQAVT